MGYDIHRGPYRKLASLYPRERIEPAAALVANSSRPDELQFLRFYEANTSSWLARSPWKMRWPCLSRLTPTPGIFIYLFLNGLTWWTPFRSCSYPPPWKLYRKCENLRKRFFFFKERKKRVSLSFDFVVFRCEKRVDGVVWI